MAVEDLRVRLGPDLKKRLDDVLEAKSVSQQAGIVKLVEWFTEQDSLVQSVVLRQISGDDVIQLAIKRMAGGDQPVSPSDRPPAVTPEMVRRLVRQCFGPDAAKALPPEPRGRHRRATGGKAG